jgi:hypothetical protein
VRRSLVDLQVRVWQQLSCALAQQTNPLGSSHSTAPIGARWSGWIEIDEPVVGPEDAPVRPSAAWLNHTPIG